MDVLKCVKILMYVSYHANKTGKKPSFPNDLIHSQCVKQEQQFESLTKYRISIMKTISFENSRVGQQLLGKRCNLI